MATLNSHPVVLRHNRPGTFSEVLLEMYFIHNGQVTHPYEVCSVHIFPDNNNEDSSNWLDTNTDSVTYGLVPSSLDASANAIFWVSGIDVKSPADSRFYDTNYEGQTTNASGIYTISDGRYGVVLSTGDQWFNTHWDPDSGEGPNVSGLVSTSSTGRYWDIWTVVDVVGSLPRTYIHSFELFRDDVITLTEPLLVTTRHHLVQKYVNKNSNILLQITSDHTVNNHNITEEIKNAFTQAVVSDAEIRILKLKDDTSTGLPYVQIQDWDSNVRIDSSDTISYLWDTTATEVEVGTYELQVRSNILDQTVVSDKFNLVVR